MIPPPEKSGPLMCFINWVTVASGSLIMVIKAAMTSLRLWLGNEQAMPTAIPEEPLISKLGTRDGSTTGSFKVLS